MVLAGCCLTARACGPDFPNTLLDSGDDAVLAAPTADFRLELQRMKLAPAEFHAVITTNTYSEDTINAELDELHQALRSTGLNDLEAARIVARHAIARSTLHKLAEHLEAVQNTAYNAEHYPDNSAATDARPAVDPPAPAEGLPAEFTHYFAGSVAWYRGLTNEAQAEWAAVLALPAKVRHYRSTWAAYMLGRSWADEDPEKAVGYYQQVRQLAKTGFADSLGLATASLGWEARARLDQKRYEEATELYFAQLAADDPSAILSLQTVAAKMTALPQGALLPLADNPQTRRLITAYIISHPHLLQYSYTPEGEQDPGIEASLAIASDIVNHWAGAVEAAGVKDLECSEELALAAYQAGDWNLAQRWIHHAPNTPTAEWLQVKLLLRAGKTDKAAQLLDEVVRRFPLAPDSTNLPPPTDLKDTLAMSGFTYRAESIDSASQVLGELGTLHLARRDYAEALDALLRAGFWLDAAYVAERVMTVDELKNYVDFNWPAPDPATTSPINAGAVAWAAARGQDFNTDHEIRYLLARRLARVREVAAARAYYPPEWLEAFDQLQVLVKQGADEGLPAADRARALFAAAWLTRTNGIELMGTEGEPDWHVYEGSYEGSLTLEQRVSQVASNRVHASEEELVRAADFQAEPNVRFHYRDLAARLGLQAAQLATNDFQLQSEIIVTARNWLRTTNLGAEFFREAAALGMQAAKNLPNDSEQTARVLCTAGWWIADYDPQTADALYKALVRRCHHTAIGQQADRKRWFPKLDQNGNLLPWVPNPPTEVLPPEPTSTDDATASNPLPASPPTGYTYILCRGNTLQDIVTAVHTNHDLEITVEDLLAANTELNPEKLKPGQRVFVPLP